MLTINLTGKLAVVTGASGDLGRVMVRTLAACGADIAVHYYRDQETAESLSAEIEGMGRRALVLQADVTQAESVGRMRDRILAELDVPHILVNNAVVQYDWKPVLEQPIADYESQFRSSVLHNVLMAQAFLPQMIRRGSGGRVIGINTECAMQCFPGQSAYVAGKRGMDGILRVLAREVGGHGITVNEVAPGWTLSEGNRDLNEADQPYREGVPLRRRGTDQEIANVVAFLASDLSSFITGAYIPVCGGNVMPGI